MKNYILTTYRNSVLLFCGIIISFAGKAQSIERSVLASSGGNFSNSTYSMEFTFAETVAQTFDNGEQLSQGFQQVWLITTAVEEAGADDWKTKVFPNPTIGILNIETEAAAKVQIFDASGRMIMKQDLAAGRGEMNLSGLPVGMYTLRMESEETEASKIFRIVKVE